MWLSPLVANEGGARFAIEHFELADTTFSFVGTTGDIGLEVGDIVQQAWDLDDLDSHYQRLVASYRERTHQSDAEALQSVLQLDADLQGLPWLDPQLPKELAPTSTSREAARGLLQLRAEWVVAARRYWESLLPLSVGHL